MSALKNLIDLNHSESVAAGTAVAMFAGPAANEQVGQALTTITGLIGLNPQIAGGVSVMYTLYRLWTKFRAGRGKKGGA